MSLSGAMSSSAHGSKFKRREQPGVLVRFLSFTEQALKRYLATVSHKNTTTVSA